MNKLLIINARIATSERVFDGDVLVEGEKIAEVGQGLSPPGVRVIDAGGKYLLPGGVDPHTHFDLDTGSARSSDDFYTGSVAAACGGTTTTIDHMAFGPKGCSLLHQAAVYRELAARSVVDCGFHGVIQHVDDEVLSDMERLRDEQGISSLKMYLTYDYKLDDGGALRVLERAKELGLVICAHCENDGVINTLRRRFAAEGHTEARFHPLSRPALAEAEAVYRFLALAGIAGGAKVYVVHLSTREGLEVIRRARLDGRENIFAETCPQYLLLDDSLYEDPREGLKYIMSPPLRKPTDQAALWGGLEAEEINAVGTDHCPFFFETQKQAGASDFTRCPNGAPGVELRMPLLFSEGFIEGRMSLPQVVRSCCTRPAEIFGLGHLKGDIRPGLDADFVLIDPDIEWTVTRQKLHERVDYTPYEGLSVRGKPVMTISRGEIIAENGEFAGVAGRGRYLRRK